MRKQQGSGKLTVTLWAGLVVFVYAAGYWTGWSNASLAAAGDVRSEPNRGRDQVRLKALVERVAVVERGVAGATDAEREAAESTGSESGSDEQQRQDADGDNAAAARRGANVLDSRGGSLYITEHGIPRAASLQRQSTDQDRALSGKQLPWAAIEALPMYRTVFRAGKKLPASGRSVLICPPWETDLDTLQIPLRHLPRKKPTSVDQKYDRRASNCLKAGIWHKITLDDHRKILSIIDHLLGTKPGEHVFDWGSGCGHKLRFLAEKKQVTGFGLDVSEKSIAYSLVNTTEQNHFCRANGARIDEWLPENYFDHALSFGSVYHVYNRTTFCAVLRSMVRVVRKGGRIYNGWTENAEYRRKDVRPCLRDLPVSVEIHEERSLFSSVPVFPLKSQQTFPNTYSVVITKNEATVPFLWTYVPVNCTTHWCEEIPYPKQ
ncbi:hypothetical protein DIPPA_20351 [Diplonema papillatum]|nr:hypothetical protein DIPPA_20351 [Diplonema papillatum]